MNEQKPQGDSPSEQGTTRRQKIVATLVVVGGGLAWGLFVAFGKHRARQAD